ncbi:MAG: hypothetical protein PVH68_04950 [Armatimonadota bacterium]|jgi:hypothetical protein
MRRHLIPAFPLILFCTRCICAAEFERGPIPRGGQTFYASFDQGPRADAGAGFPEMHYAGSYWGRKGWEFVYGEGREGKSLDLRPEQMTPERRRRARGEENACFKFQGHVCLRVGTLSFWVRAAESTPLVEISSQSNDTSRPHLLLRLRRQSVTTIDRNYASRSLALRDATLSDGEWHHVALVWDESQGMRAYLDGEECASDWGTGAYQAGYLSAGRLLLSGAEFDEVRVFDWALPPERIKPLSGRLTVTTFGGIRLMATPAPAEHRLEHLSWTDAPRDRFVPLSGPTLIRRVDLADARALRISGWRAVDGREDSVWPVHYHGYEYLGGGALHVTLGAGEQFNWVRTSGMIDAASLCVGDEWTRPDDARELAKLTGRRFISNYRLPQPCSAPAVSVYPEKDRGYYRSERRELHDMTLLDVQPGRTPSDPDVLKCFLTDEQPETVTGDNRVRLIHWYRPGERTAWQASRATPAPKEVAVEPLRFHHIMLPAQPRDVPMSAVRLTLNVDGWSAGNTVNVRLHDPFNLWRALMDVDVRVETAGRLDLTLQFPPTILPADTELWLTLISREGGRLRCGSDGSTVTLHGPAMDEAKQSYLAWQHRLLKDTFAALSEPRPWGNNTFDDTFLRVALAPYDGIARMAWDLHRRFPTDRWTRGYMLFTHPRDAEYWASLPIDLPRDPRVPRWALLQKELLKEFLYFVNWWIDERQVPNGELGNFYGDDTDLVADWLSLAMTYDPDGKLAHSVRRIADYCWETKIHNGLNIRTKDSLHAYEEGINVQPYVALMDYGNPVRFERLMATARRYDGWLLSDPEDGKRRLRGEDFGDTEVHDSPEVSSYGPLIMHPGLTVMWYNGNRRLTQLVSEYFDGTPSLRDQSSGVPLALYQQTRDDRYVKRPDRVATNPWWLRIMNLQECPPDVLDGLIQREYPTGTTRSLGCGDYVPLEKYAAWHYTRDKGHLVPALEFLWKQTYYTMFLYTKTEQSGDRVAIHKNLTDFMYLGGMPGARNNTVPHFAVSYEGFSPRFAALVLDDTPELLRWVGFSFDEQPQRGALRVWNLAPGTYEVRMGVDADGDDQIDGAAQARRMELKRYETILVTLPSHKLYIVEAKCIRKDVPLYDRCDLAISHEDASRERDRLTVIAHNLGCRPTGPFTVEVRGPKGKLLGSVRHAGLESAEDLEDRKVAMPFDGLPPTGALEVTVRGEAKEITEVNNAARIPAHEQR